MTSCLIRLALLGMCCLAMHQAYAQQTRELDSLLNLLNQVNSDRLDVLSRLSFAYRDEAPAKALEYGLEAETLAKQKGDSSQLPHIYSYIGIAYRNLGDYARASEYFYYSLRIAQQRHDSVRVGYAYVNIANVLINQADYAAALDYLFKSVSIAEVKNERVLLGYAYVNISRVYDAQNNLPGALDFLLKTLLVRQQLNDIFGLAVCQTEIGINYRKQRKERDALLYFEQAYANSSKLQSKLLRSQIRNEHAMTLLGMGNAQQAIVYAEEARALALESQAREYLLYATSTLSDAYALLGNYAESLRLLKAANALRQELFTLESTRKIANLQSALEIEKKQVQIERLLRQRDDQNNAQFILITSLLMVSVAAVIAYMGYARLQRARKLLADRNVVIQQQNQSIHKQNEMISQANEEVQIQNERLAEALSDLQHKTALMQESLHYAKQLQQASLPGEGILHHLLPDSFVWYQPRYEVSGDFYWVHAQPQRTLLAVADCTGYGISSGMIAVISDSLLMQIVNDHPKADPAQLLLLLHEGLLRVLHSTDTQEQGLSISIVAIDKMRGQVQYAGARTRLVMVNEEGYSELLGLKDRAGWPGLAAGAFVPELQQLVPTSPSMCYLFSDGINNQLGGQGEAQRYTMRRLRDTLTPLHSLPPEQQRQRIQQAYDDWRGHRAPVDDVLIVGFRVG